MKSQQLLENQKSFEKLEKLHVLKRKSFQLKLQFYIFSRTTNFLVITISISPKVIWLWGVSLTTCAIQLDRSLHKFPHKISSQCRSDCITCTGRCTLSIQFKWFAPFSPCQVVISLSLPFSYQQCMYKDPYLHIKFFFHPK